MLRITKRRPIDVKALRTKVAQPRPMAAAPILTCTTPAVISFINVATFELAMCCQNTESKVIIVDIRRQPNVTAAIGLVAKFPTFWSLPSPSSSRAQPGNVPSIRIDNMLKANDINLIEVSGSHCQTVTLKLEKPKTETETYIRPLKSTLSLNPLAISMMPSGS